MPSAIKKKEKDKYCMVSHVEPKKKKKGQFHINREQNGGYQGLRRGKSDVDQWVHIFIYKNYKF